MVLDEMTLLIVSGVIIILCGLSFILNTSMNRNDGPGRIWSLAFLASILAAMSFAIYGADSSAWGALIAANASFTVALGSMWSGARVFNGGPARYWIVSGIAVIVALAVLVRGPDAGGWAGAFELYAAVSLFAVLGAGEAIRGRMRRNINGQVLVATSLVVSAYYAARAIVFLVDGPEGELFQGAFGTTPTTVINIVLVVSAAMALSVLRAERFHGSAVGDQTIGIYSAAGVLSAKAFEQAAADHIERIGYHDGHLALIGVDADRLPELNTAFGRTAGDQAIAAFGESLRRSAPPLSVIGHCSAGHFLVLVCIASVAEGRAVAARIQMALVDDPLPGSQSVRLTASLGLADTFTHSSDLAGLTAAVNEAIADVQGAGGNDVRVAAALVQTRPEPGLNPV
jgi:diguanylate cyclase (GGDEF)-like protein